MAKHPLAMGVRDRTHRLQALFSLSLLSLDPCDANLCPPDLTAAGSILCLVQLVPCLFGVSCWSGAMGHRACIVSGGICGDLLYVDPLATR